jgi:hypothetical protein
MVSIHAPRVGRRLKDGRYSATVYVSIHAPRLGGDFTTLQTQANGLVVSIHAPAWGATKADPCWYSITGCFNPRPRVGGDLNEKRPKRIISKFQSTPTHGRRHNMPRSQINPRPRGGTPAYTRCQSPWAVLQSTPPWGDANPCGARGLLQIESAAQCSEQHALYGVPCVTYMIHSFHTPLGRVNLTVVVPSLNAQNCP